jgi:hypothetical protein
MVSIGPAPAAASAAIPLLAGLCGRALRCGAELACGEATFFFPDFALADFFLETFLDLNLDLAMDFFAFALDLNLDFLAMQFLPYECWQSIGLDQSNKPSSFSGLSNNAAHELALTALGVGRDVFYMVTVSP